MLLPHDLTMALNCLHAESDGETERVNAGMEQYLGVIVGYQLDNWTILLPLAEFSQNTQVWETTDVSPLFVNSGFNP